jgi:prephenate dehydrogenase
MHWQKVTLVGVGLLGGSLGLALKQRRLAGCVHGFVRRESSVSECLGQGAVDEAGLDLARAVRDADLVVFCTPIAQMRSLAEAMAPLLKKGALVTDVGSVKGTVVADLEPLVHHAGGEFVGSHPMAGSERTGVAEARSDLFEKALCVVTPTDRSSPEAVGRIEALWRSVGGITMTLNPDLHDELVSRSSHLPHVMAAELARYVLNPAWPKEQAALCANGFRDTTRIASGSPEMWRDICLANRRHLDRALETFLQDLAAFRALLNGGDEKELERFFRRAKERRDQWQAQPAPSSSE